MLADMRFRYMPLLVVLLQGEEVKKKMCLCGDRIVFSWEGIRLHIILA